MNMKKLGSSDQDQQEWRKSCWDENESVKGVPRNHLS
jgi:hypothetical protein